MKRSLLRFNPLWIITACGLLWAAPAFSFCFAPQLRVSDEYFVSTMVINGTVISQKLEIDPADPDGSTGTFYRVRVDKTWRGSPANALTIYSENSTARFPMTMNRAYVLFITRWPDGRWVIDNCGHSGLLRSSQRVIAAIQQLPLAHSFVYGEVYQSYGAPGASCRSMELRIHNSTFDRKTAVTSTCKFNLNVPPGEYRATLLHDGKPVLSNGLDYKDPYCFSLPAGGSAGLAFRTTDGIDDLNLSMMRKEDQDYRDFCARPHSDRSSSGSFN